MLALKVAAVLLAAFGAGNRLRALDADAMQAMVIVEGDLGRGSAFFVKMGGKIYLVTNSHVVRGNRNVKYRNLNNVEIAAGALEIADKVDAVRAAVDEAGNTLELEPHIDKISIGDEVVVAGNSEGEGVVREIPGKVVGIGPDRIEVDAQFVPGNSGSPILLKSTGKVIGVATYMKVPRGLGAGAKSPFSLNEVRRFGYRLDTVARWIKPAGKDRLLMEGLKLAEMENLMTAIGAVFGSNASMVSKWGVSGFVSKEKAQHYPAFAALAAAIEDFSKIQAAAKSDDDKAKNAADFFAKIEKVVSDDVRGLDENQFSGYYSVQLKESLARCKVFYDWCDGTMMPAFREGWLSAKFDSRITAAPRSTAAPIDPAKVHLVLSDHIAPNEPPDYCHHVTYPAETQPANLENIFWIIEDPKGERRSFPMHRTGLRVRTPVHGVYHIWVEYRGADKPRVVSTIAEVKYMGVAGATSGNVPAGADETEANALSATKDQPFVNSLGMKFVPAPGTQALFCIWDTRVQDYAAYAAAKIVDGAWKKQEREGLPVSREPDYPVVGVSRDDANAFCQWLTEKETAEGKLPKGMKYRLPTDEEWSRAAGLTKEDGATPRERDGKNQVNYPWGTEYPPVKGKVGNYADGAFHEKFPKSAWIEGSADGYATTSPVGSFPANEYGLYDMGGNVWQWCEDQYEPGSPARVQRGASWNSSDRIGLLASTRSHNPPGLRTYNRGFRCVVGAARQ